MAGQPEQQLAQLQLLLSAVHRTRTALPRLVSTLTSPSAADRTTLYRTAHQECHAAIAALQDQLDLNAHSLEHADQVAREDPPVDPLPPRPRPRTSTPHASWDQVQDILQTTTTTKQRRIGTTSSPQQLPVPTSPADLDALLKAITTHYHPRVHVHIRTTGHHPPPLPPRQLEFTLRGVLRARIELRWADDGCQADYVTCHSLMEDPKPSHVDSQFALFRSLSNEAINIIDQSRRSRRTAAVRSLEEVLVFLSDPPLPF
ncbi:hypothetical protein RHOSPDRAFT_34553 [Rhodotorula sp. JG-1b]|nr:hypothetical protein RHOSPDRAFT_34553 [Rhodotorula sp. JG-1b]